ncbi:MAG: dihydrolipoamide acetyltransferase family protein [Thermoleophilia bacterium]
MAFEFKFPDVGEGITEGELLSWKVKEGDVVVEDQTLAEIETDKAVVEMPSPRAGRIVKLHAEEGETIEVGQVIVTIEEGAAAGAPAPETPETLDAPEAPEAPKVPEVPAVPAPAAAATPATPVPPPPPASQVEEEEEFYTGSVIGQLEEAPDEPEEPSARIGAAAAAAAGDTSSVKVLAMPSVRVLAKELGVDLSVVHGTGPGGRILRQDVEDHAEAAVYGRPTVSAPAVPVAEVETAEAWMGGALSQDEHGVVERVTFKGIRRTMARRMAESLSKQAQVTTTDDVDITIIRRIREKERTLAAERGIRLTYLAFVIKAVATALQRFPRINSVLEETCEELVLKRYYNIGIAIDTKAGLVVPNLKDVESKGIFKIAEEVVDLVERAQERRLDLSELRGGTFTITNYGAIGGTYATPVTNYPEIAILGMGRVRDLPVVRKGEIVVRQMLPLSLTYDHQVIDGAEATRFLNLVISYLEDPDLLLLEGA